MRYSFTFYFKWYLIEKEEKDKLSGHTDWWVLDSDSNNINEQ